MVENIMGKGENDGFLTFYTFPKMFSKIFFFKVIKSRDCVVKSYGKCILNSLPHDPDL